MRSRITAWILAVPFALARGDAAGQEDRAGALWSAFERDRTLERALELASLGEAGSPALLAALADPATSSLAACALSRQPVAALREALEKTVSSGDQVAGYWAAKALGALGDARSAAILASRLSREPRRYWELAFPSGRGYRPVFERIRVGRDETVFATPDIPNLRVACAALEALGAIPGAEAAAALEEALRSDQHLVRYGAVRGLVRRLEASRDLLQNVARADPVLYVRRAAGRPLSAPPPSLDALQRVPAIAFLKTRNRTESNLGFRDSYFFPKTPWYAWGEDLFTLTPPAPGGVVRNLTRLPEGGAVQGPEPSPEGKQILVALRERAGEPFHVHEISVETGERRQLTRGSANDVDPCYLPGGRIAFSSDRDGTLEYYHQERTRALYVMEADGSGLRQITFNPNQDYEPLALRDGRILYSSYRFYGQDGSRGIFSESPGSIARIETQLRSVLPDGAHDSHVYGSQRGGFYVPVRALPDGDQFQAPSLLHGSDHLGVSVSQAREMDDHRIVCITPAGLTVVDPKLDPRDCEVPIFPEVVNLAGGEEVYIHDHDDMNPVGRYTSPYPLGGSLVLVSHAPWHRRGGRAYGIYLLDLDSGEKTLLYDDPEWSDFDPIPLVPRLPEYADPLQKTNEAATPTGLVTILSVFESDVDFDRSKVKYLRVLSSERLGVSMNANGGFRSRVLATVPVEKDGSVQVEVPADTPLHFNLLDGGESVLVHETEHTYVRPGERRTCIGCHERKSAAPSALKPPPTALSKPAHRALPASTDLIYLGQPARSYSVIHR